MTTWTPQPRQMERIKRRLHEVPALLGSVRRIGITGLPVAADIDGQLRLEGLVCLLQAAGLAVTHGPGEAGIWLGEGEPDVAAPPLLFWPRADVPPRILAAVAAQAGQAGMVCVADPDRLALVRSAGGRGLLLPDPSHALWGLLDQHPQGEGCLHLPQGGGWDGLVPLDRIKLLGRLQAMAEKSRPLHRPLTLARRRVIEAARRAVVAYAELESDSIGPGLLAALLGRGIRTNGCDAITAYWTTWASEGEITDQAA